MSNRIIKDTIAITVITLVAGLALGVVQDITADPIAKQEAQAKQDAYKAVFADADSFDVVDVDADALQSYLDENGYAAQSVDETMLAKDASGNELGYAFTVTTSEGYGGDIQFAMGIMDDGTLNGITTGGSTNADPTMMTIVSLLALIVNIVAFIYIIRTARKKKKNPYKEEIFTDFKYYKNAAARAEIK